MRNTATVLGIGALVIAATSGAFALGRSGNAADSNPRGERDLASLIASANEHDGVRDLAGTDGGFETRCFEDLPTSRDDGTLVPQLAAFPARVLSEDFELRALRFRESCDAATQRSKRLDTVWLHTPTGKEVRIGQVEGNEAYPRLSAYYASFHEDAFDFWVTVLPTGHFASEGDEPALRRTAILAGLEDLRPPIPMTCFARNEPKGWADLDAHEIGDPRPAVPAGFLPRSLEFTVYAPPDGEDCPSAAPARNDEPGVSFTATFAGPGSTLLSLHAASRLPQGSNAATFQPGAASWADDQYAYSMQWNPEFVSDAQARAIAALLDPEFGDICAVTGEQVPFADLSEFNLIPPTVAGFAGYLEGPTQFWAMGTSAACPARAEPGFFARWTMQLSDRPGLIEVFAMRGELLPNLRPPWAEERSIYWRRSDETEFYVVGIKASFERSELLEVARLVDPGIIESQLTVPAAP